MTHRRVTLTRLGHFVERVRLPNDATCERKGRRGASVTGRLEGERDASWENRGAVCVRRVPLAYGPFFTAMRKAETNMALFTVNLSDL